jgi:hypothetical protein
MMEAANTSEMLMNFYQPIRRKNPENSHHLSSINPFTALERMRSKRTEFRERILFLISSWTLVLLSLLHSNYLFLDKTHLSSVSYRIMSRNGSARFDVESIA